MIINMWSGPRNLSTALMRSFENREDTEVWDEPLYAYYLKNTKLRHPMNKEIIKNYETNINTLISKMTSKNLDKKIFYLKHMTHHMIKRTPINWIKKNKNCLLIRKPEKVISSYLKKNILNRSEDLGFPNQIKIYKFLKKNKLDIVIINSDDLILNSEKTIKLLCKKLKINFRKKMLNWPKGARVSDGIWGKIWYKNVVKTNSFQSKMIEKKIQIPSKYNSILRECNKIYDELNLYNINNIK